MKILFTLTLSLLFSANIAAATDSKNPKLTDPRLQDYQKLINEMSPEQKKQLMEQAKKMEEKLKKMSPQDLQELKKQTLETTKKIDFDNVDVENLDTSQPVSLEKTREMMIEVK